MPPARSVAIFARHFAASYLLVAPRILYRMTLSVLVDPKGAQKFIHDTMDAMDYASEDSVLGSVELSSIFPRGDELTMKAPFHTDTESATRSLLELGCLAHVVRSIPAKTVFEIGTYLGRTARLLAINAGEDAKIFTLDLPQELVRHRVGRDCAETAEAVRIVQLTGDSRFFDYAPWKGRCDFVWVDGNHDYEFVASDTAKALDLCRPGGWIGWHDYWHSCWWYGVTRCVREQRGHFPFIRHIRGTTIVLARRGEP
jgi:hypothetical protein